MKLAQRKQGFGWRKRENAQQIFVFTCFGDLNFQCQINKFVFCCLTMSFFIKLLILNFAIAVMI